LFRVTGQAPSDLSEESVARLTNPFTKAGFQVESKLVEVKSSRVLILIASKSIQANIQMGEPQCLPILT
jgi:hypothetical protein